MKKQIIIVAGGKGTRMNSNVPKQFLPLCGKPLLMHTLERFHQFDAECDIVLVLPQDQLDYWQQLCAEYHFNIKHRIVLGGSERFFSVKNGLALAEIDSLVAIHDAVRPFVSNETLQRCFDTAAKLGNAIPCMPIAESLRYTDGNTNHAVKRSDYKAIQTPQVFQYQQIKKAFEQEYSPLFTDDASVVEAMGEPIHLVEGNMENIKITTPFDLLVGEAILKSQNATK